MSSTKSTDQAWEAMRIHDQSVLGNAVEAYELSNYRTVMLT